MVAVEKCGLKPWEFWRLNPFEFELICKHKEQEEKGKARMFAIGLANLMQPHSKRKVNPNNWLPARWEITEKEKSEQKKSEKKKVVPGQATEQLKSFLNRRSGGVPTASVVDNILDSVIQKGKEIKNDG